MNDLSEDLLCSLRSGDCVAFVGSGFAGAAKLPSWSKLLDELSHQEGFDPARRAHVQALLKKETAHAYDEAAQVIEDMLGRAAFTEQLRARMANPALTDAMKRRLGWLHGIPFRAILTTNFDGVLDGETPGIDSFWNVLRPEGSNPWWKRLFHSDQPRPVPVLKIHGDVRHPETVVITRRDYRRLLYGNPGYRAFLRAVLAHRPVLYIGFSFTDAYLNELRSEILALLGYSGEVPVAYAIINDVPVVTREHYRRHEGIEILTYDTSGGTDFSGFDKLLKQLHDQTNPLFHFGALLHGRRLLWVDPRRTNNEHLRSFFRLTKDVAAVRQDSFVVEHVLTLRKRFPRSKPSKMHPRPFTW